MMKTETIQNFRPLQAKPADPKQQAKEKLEKLRKVSEQFESILVRQVLKSMRNTVPEGGLIARGLEMDIFESLFDDEIAKRMSERHQLGFADLVFRQLSGKLNLGIPLEEILNQAQEVQKKAKATEFLDEPKTNFKPIVQKAAQRFGLEPELIEAMIHQESSGNPFAVSQKGAKGLMQLMDSTATMLGVRNVFDPEENIMAGARYLKDLLNQFDNDIELALASYNAGPGNVRRYNGIPPFNETRNYVRRVMERYAQLKQTRSNSANGDA